MSNHAHRHHRRRRPSYPRVIPATYTDHDDAIEAVQECGCGGIVSGEEGVLVVRQLHRHLCPVLRRIKREAGR